MEGEFIGCERIGASFLEFSQIGVAEVLKVHIRSSARCGGGLSCASPWYGEGQALALRVCAGGNPSHPPYSSGDFCLFISICNCR